MVLTLNGQSKDVEGVRTVAELVRSLGLERAACAVEVNQALVPKGKHGEHELHAGDRVEVVTLVGGG